MIGQIKRMMAVMADRERKRRTDGALRGTYQSLRRQFLRRCAAERRECHFGDGPIDYTLRHGDERAPTVHHTVPVALRPDLEMETSLWAPAHALCNKLNEAAFADGCDGLRGSENDGYGIPSECWD